MRTLAEWWQDVVNPIVKPTADPAKVALEMLRAGKIDQETYDDTLARLAATSVRTANTVKVIQEESAARAAASNPIAQVIAPVNQTIESLTWLIIVGVGAYLLLPRMKS